MTREQFYNAVRYMRLKPAVVDMRIHFDGGSALRKALDENPELEAELILREATRDADLLYQIKERACIRQADGLSDTLLSAVLCNIIETGNTEQLDVNGQIISPPQTDWDKELSRYSR